MEPADIRYLRLSGVRLSMMVSHLYSLRMSMYVMEADERPQNGQFVMSEIRLGSRGDSYYEYLIK